MAESKSALTEDPAAQDSKLELGLPQVSEDEAFHAAADSSAGAIPKGTIDPVYEAKARVLNHAVNSASGIFPTCPFSGPNP